MQRRVATVIEDVQIRTPVDKQFGNEGTPEYCDLERVQLSLTVRAEISAPRDRSFLAMDSVPSHAALCSGVTPSLFASFRSHPASMSSSAARGWQLMAINSGVSMVL